MFAKVSILALVGIVLSLNAVSGFKTPMHSRQLLATRLPQISNIRSELSTLKSSPLQKFGGEMTLKMADAAAPAATTKPTSSLWNAYLKTMDFLTVLFPLWTVLFASWAIVRPQAFSWFTTKYFTMFLGALMLSMGITLTPQDFVRVAQQPGAVIVGFLFCYVFCPLFGLLLGKAFKLPVDLVAGLVLIGSVNGGQASNLCTYIAKGDVALSVLMTTVTTIAGIFMTPLLCKTLLGAVVPVDAVGIAKSCMEVVLAPIVVGMATNKFFPKLVEAILPITPVIGVASTCLLVASAVAQCSQSIVNAGMQLQIPVMLFHFLSGIVGYYIPKMLKFNEVQSRTMAIETAMKSSAFGFLLAQLHFKQYATRIPGAVSLVWMALAGASMAVFWRNKPIPAEETKTA